ncbi:lysozyme [Granulicella cerasi]|uniref:Lysozyme n=1 Tax=Granulicella cerasi TaxID=741063 RepID=A0ABW1ZBV4_9BACT|nr:lysozyme [Granulicella cerasi]
MLQEFGLSAAGLELIRSCEGLREVAYQDAAGVWTIGYGHTGADVRAGRHVSEFEAEALLRADVAATVRFVNKVVTVAIVQCQFDALVSFCYNVGRGSFERSSLLLALNRGDVRSAALGFGAWVRAGGKVLPGLVARRKAEAAMFRGMP